MGILELKTVGFNDVQHWFVDFQKKSKYLDLPPDEAEFIGIFQDNVLIGYFITIGQDYDTVEVEQGYLVPTARHSNLPKECMKMLESVIKKVGYKAIRIGTVNRFKSYTKFMSSLGYSPERIIYSKKVN